MNQFDVSVIIPVYNCEKLIKDSVKSILNQDYGDLSRIQIILVDDGSTDNSLKVCNELKNNIKELTIDVITGPNGGVYDQYESFIIYKRQGNRYKYYVRLIEDADERTGFNFEDIDNINEVKNNNIKKITKEIGLNKVSSESIDKLNADSEVQAKCPLGVDEYFAMRRPD